MKINCAIIVNSLEEKENCLNKFDNIKNKLFFTFNENIKSINLLKSKKNFFSELKLFFKDEMFFYLHADEEIILFDEEEAYKSHYNFVIEDWIVKNKRNNSEKNEVSKIFIRSNFRNMKKFDDDWCHLYSGDGVFANKLQEYILFHAIEENELYLTYEYVLERLKNGQNLQELNMFVNQILNKTPLFLELIVLWGDYLYELNLFNEAKVCYANALKMADHRQIYDMLPMIPSMHKKHPEKMLFNIDGILKKYDN